MRDQTPELRPDIEWVKIAIIVLLYGNDFSLLKSKLQHYQCITTNPEQALLLQRCIMYATSKNGLSENKNLRAVLGNKTSPKLSNEIFCILAYEGSLEQIKQYIREGKLQYMARQDGITPLISAIRGKNFDVARFLLSDSNPQRQLVLNLIKNSSRELSILFKEMSKSNCLNEMEKVLIEMLPDSMLKQPTPKWPLIHYAAAYGLIGLVKKILEKAPNALEALDEHGATPLIFAAKNGQNEVTSYLISQQANLNVTNERYANYPQMTPLLWSIKRRYFDTAKLLLEAGANVNQADSNKRDPLSYVIGLYPNMAIYLIFYGAKITRETRKTLFRDRNSYVTALDTEIRNFLQKDKGKTKALIGTLQIIFHTSRSCMQKLDQLHSNITNGTHSSHRFLTLAPSTKVVGLNSSNEAGTSQTVTQRYC